MKLSKLLRKIVVVIIGVPIVVIGIILIPLPGPGLLISFLGLFILSLEFEWAGKYVDQIRGRIKHIYQNAQKRADAVGKSTEKKRSDDR